jgi:hypothetical protein
MTVSEQIIQVLDALCEKFGIVINWTSENVIPYVETLCKKLITYEITMSVSSMIFSLILIIGSIIAAKMLYPVFKKGLEKEDDTYGVGWSSGSLFAIVGLVIVNLSCICSFTDDIADIIKCVTFPEMYIFEYISTLIKGL